jgi:predicted Zn-dependent protease
MMRFSRFSILALLALFLLPYPIQAEESGGQTWRHRESMNSEDVASDDVSEEVRFGREVAARMIGRFSLYENPALMKYVNLVGRSLARNTNRPELEFHFAVLNTGEINAYAAPGGFVFVTRGAIEKMQDEAELAAVLGHEMTHINERHVVKELNIHGTEGSATAGLARLIGGGTESARVAFYQSVDKALDMLFKTGYGREDEIQADRGAVLLCALSGYDPSGLARYFDRIAAVKGKPTETLDKTHPAFADRIAWLKDMIVKEGIDTASLKDYKERFTDAQKTIK